MTPANPDALADALATCLNDSFRGVTFCGGRWSEAACNIAVADLLSGPLAPILAALQRVTAKRDDEQAEDERFAIAYTTARGAVDYEHMARVLSGRLRRMDRRAAAANRRADNAEARAAQLQAEVEAKDRHVALADRVKAQLEVAQGALVKIDRGGKPMREIAARALLDIAMVPYPAEIEAARAATAREGQTHTPASGALKIKEADRA